MFAGSGAREAAFFSDSNEITELMNLHWKSLLAVTVRPSTQLVQKRSDFAGQVKCDG
jgi:hypothetical protein